MDEKFNPEAIKHTLTQSGALWGFCCYTLSHRHCAIYTTEVISLTLLLFSSCATEHFSVFQISPSLCSSCINAALESKFSSIKDT